MLCGMSLYALGDRVPSIDPLAFVHPDAVIIGSVTVAAESSIWPGAVLRGDHGRIVIGSQTSIQDGTVIHCTSELDTIVGDRCVVGHIAHLEGCIVEDDALIGSGSVVLQRARIGTGALVGANAVVSPGTQVPPGALALGIPARIREGGADADLIRRAVEIYVHNSHWYREELRRID